VEPIEKIMALPQGELFLALTLLALFVLAMKAVLGSYYRRTGRPRWKFARGMSEFPYLHLNTREWSLTLLVAASYLTSLALVTKFT